MKLYYHPISTTCRPIMLFAAEQGIPLDMQVVDLFTGEHTQKPYGAINPNHLIPVLEDGDFRLTESSAIMKYLAEKVGSPLYPKDLQQRARQRAHGLDQHPARPRVLLRRGLPADLSPQQAPQPGGPGRHAAVGQGARAGLAESAREHILGTGNTYLCGASLTIADYYGAAFLTLGEVIGCDFAAYPNVRRWLARMKALKSWQPVNATLDGAAAAHKGESFVTV